MVIHDLDMARWLLGEEPVEVMAIASRLVDESLEKLTDFDTVMVQLRTASGKQCHINCCREAVYGYDQRMEVSGSKGMLLQENLRPVDDSPLVEGSDRCSRAAPQLLPRALCGGVQG